MGGMGMAGGGAGLNSGGWIISAGLDQTVKVRSHTSPFYSQHVSLLLLFWITQTWDASLISPCLWNNVK
jgi:hypothetical protein